ncbi:MAG: hypothetical protein EA351_09870 [Gemmatimonadales bacterium]|nr:MAG: hypothetical protein EA351_09870 [Gemmatimonadales bacterium]
MPDSDVGEGARGAVPRDSRNPDPLAPGLGDRAQELLLVGIGALARLLPERLAQWVGSRLGWLAGSVLRIRRGTVEENLERAFPDWSRDRRVRAARAAYRHLGREAIVLLRLGAMSPGEVRERSEIRGESLLRDALDEGKGVVLLAGHLGNWEFAGAALAARDVPLDVVGRKQSNPLFDERVREMREGFGMRPIYRHAALRPVLKGVREGRVVALVADQNVRSGGVFVDFFGIPASAAKGPGVIPLRTGAPVMFMAVTRLPGWRARYRMEISPIAVAASGDTEADVLRVVAEFHRLLEDAVRRAPEQYFWFHRRWKTRPPEEFEPSRNDARDRLPGTR